MVSACDQVFEFTLASDEGLVILCLADLCLFSETPNLPVRGKQFRQYRAQSVLLQDVMLLCVQLWPRSRPFVSIFPICDPAPL